MSYTVEQQNNLLDRLQVLTAILPKHVRVEPDVDSGLRVITEVTLDWNSFMALAVSVIAVLEGMPT